jgi:hypothetical protein
MEQKGYKRGTFIKRDLSCPYFAEIAFIGKKISPPESPLPSGAQLVILLVF